VIAITANRVILPAPSGFPDTTPSSSPVSPISLGPANPIFQVGIDGPTVQHSGDGVPGQHGDLLIRYSRKLSSGVHVIASVHGDVHAITGYDSHELLASSWWLDHLHPEDRMRVLGALSSLLEEGQWSIEYRCRNKQGVYHRIRDEAVLQRNATGRPDTIVGTWRLA